jgi:cell division protein FtsB
VNVTHTERANQRGTAGRTRIGVALLALGLAVIPAAAVRAQGEPNAEQLKKMYDDALAQLRAAQDRKNELATENEKLNARLAELERQVNELRQEKETWADRTLFLRSHHAAWLRFIERYPEVQARWRLFLEADPMAVPAQDVDVLDRHWPWISQG